MSTSSHITSVMATPTSMPARSVHSRNGAATIADRIAAGKARRNKVPRSAHAGWTPPNNRPDPVALLEESSLGRLPDFIPIRYGRMLISPFAFFRASAAIMANDLSSTPSTGLKVQACGDAHLANFGAYATPERNFIFGINDFDETLPAPWEWDIKRLCASIVVAGRVIGLSKKTCAKAVLVAVNTYRERVREYATMTALQVWYSRLEVRVLSGLVGCVHCKDFKAKPHQVAHSHQGVLQLPKLTTLRGGKRRIVDRPPLIFHPKTGSDTLIEHTRQAFLQYRQTLRDDLRVLFDRYDFVDSAVKVVGVGSVGTRCGVALFMASNDDPLFLQIKEAMPSVLEPYAGKSSYANHGQRIVTGQRLVQAASDMFLGWIRRDDGRDFYVRQLRDMKASAHIDHMNGSDLANYAHFCAWTLARAHARSGDSGYISGYLGQKYTFDRAIVEFASDYADQNERDYSALMSAVKSGKIIAKTD